LAAKFKAGHSHLGYAGGLQMIFWQRHGVFIARAQMVIWTRHCVLLLEAIVLCIQKEAQASGYVQVDETPVRYMDPENPGRCSQGYLWTTLVPKKCVVYEWHASRAAACLDSLLGKECAGKIQCDGYSAYTAFARDKEIILIGCMAYLRRGFFEAREQSPGIAGWILNQIGILYGWEEQLRQSRAGPALREPFLRAINKELPPAPSGITCNIHFITLSRRDDHSYRKAWCHCRYFRVFNATFGMFGARGI
jgi:hypothetical protein